MKKIIDLITNYYANQPPYIRISDNGEYSLVGNSDLATGQGVDYKGIGYFYLTARNHTNTLLALMKFLIVVDALDEKNMLDFEDDEILSFLENESLNILESFFMQKMTFDYDLLFSVLSNNKQLINEALYNVTNDKEIASKPTYEQIVDSLEGEQFEDFYIDIAYNIAKEFKLRPSEVIENWTTSELIVLFAKLSNENSLENFLNYKYSQPKAPKRKAPKKQLFYFEDIGEVEEVEEVKEEVLNDEQ